MKTMSLLLPFLLFLSCSQAQVQERNGVFPNVADSLKSKFNQLSSFENYVINQKGTERAFSGAYWNTKENGTYLCRQCNQPLFSSDAKFDSGTGWPSFDDYLPGAVTEVRDADGYRVEIVCSNCGGHLGHVFRGEFMTMKNTRHCANSASLQFISQGNPMPETIK